MEHIGGLQRWLCRLYLGMKPMFVFVLIAIAVAVVVVVVATTKFVWIVCCTP